MKGYEQAHYCASCYNLATNHLLFNKQVIVGRILDSIDFNCM